jgi:hypothetical protein
MEISKNLPKEGSCPLAVPDPLPGVENMKHFELEQVTSYNLTQVTREHRYGIDCSAALRLKRNRYYRFSRYSNIQRRASVI